jgi:hypothetical protein
MRNRSEWKSMAPSTMKGLARRRVVPAMLVALAGCSGSGTILEDPVTGPVVRNPAQGGGGNSLSVNLSAADTTVRSGETVQLNWTSDKADKCEASGGWNGSKPKQGSTTVGPLTSRTTFTLTCSGKDGNAVAMLSVSIAGVVTLNWQPPAENVDGTPLTDLSGYRIYYGEQSKEYANRETVLDPRAVKHDVALVSGSYYFAMTALDSEGNESGYSNEVTRVLD